MNRTFFILSLTGLAILLSQGGCRSTGEKNQTGWSIPTVKLTPFTKNDKVTPPAEKADPNTTAALAKDRLNGHNPTVLVRQGEDLSLTPDPEEIAQLSRLEGSQVPQWAAESTLAPAPEATASLPSLRIAKNVTPSAMEQANQTSSPAEEAVPNSLPGTPAAAGTAPENAIASTTAQLPNSMPNTVPAPEALSAPGQTPQLPTPGAASSQVLASTDAPNGMGTELPASLPASLPTAPAGPAVSGNSAAPEALASTLPGELPAQLPANVPSSLPTSLPAAQGGNVQVSASLPTPGSGTAGLPSGTVSPAAAVADSQPTAGSQVKPAALFMPGNIDPQYPNIPSQK